MHNDAERGGAEDGQRERGGGEGHQLDQVQANFNLQSIQA